MPDVILYCTTIRCYPRRRSFHDDLRFRRLTLPRHWLTCLLLDLSHWMPTAHRSGKRSRGKKQVWWQCSRVRSFFVSCHVPLLARSTARHASNETDPGSASCRYSAQFPHPYTVTQRWRWMKNSFSSPISCRRSGRAERGDGMSVPRNQSRSASQSICQSARMYVQSTAARPNVLVFTVNIGLASSDGISSSSLPCGTRLARRQMFHLSEGLAATGVEAG